MRLKISNLSFPALIITCVTVILFSSACSSGDDMVALNSRIVNGELVLGNDPVYEDDEKFLPQKKVDIQLRKNILKPADNSSDNSSLFESSLLEKPLKNPADLSQANNKITDELLEAGRDSISDRAELREQVNKLNNYLLTRLDSKKSSDNKAVFNKRKLKTLMDLYYVNLDKSATNTQLKNFAKYVKGALKGSAAIQTKLADFYLDGLNGESYEELAAAWYLLAANNDSTYAKYMLSILFQQGIGVDQDLKKSVSWYKQAEKDKNHAKAQLQVAKRYLVPFSIMHNPKEAAIWMEEAAKHKNIEAQNLLADMYLQGRGVSKSELKALNWYGKSAGMGSAYGQYSLGIMYYNGQGVAQNMQEAYKWLTYAAYQGYAEAQYLLGVMYEQGFGVEKSLAKAYAWWQVIPKGSVVADDFDAKLSNLIATMTPKEKLNADKLTRQYKSKIRT